MKFSFSKIMYAVSALLLMLLVAACTALPRSDIPTMTVAPPAAPATEAAPPLSEGGELRPMPVEAVTIEIGVGSPIPVEVLVSGTWPDLCAQLAKIEQSVSGQRIEINLLASAADPNCPPDRLGLPYRLAVPLNLVEVQTGQYTVVVNGFETSFEWTGTSAEHDDGEEPVPGAATIAYIGMDGNLWVLQSSNKEQRQITQDGMPAETNSSQPAPVVSYYFPKISSDGRYVAVRRDAETPFEAGMRIEYGLWVYDLSSGEARLVYDQNPAGFAWKPGSHLLAYGRAVEEGYFFNRADQPDASLATGIWGIDLDTGAIGELVRPERGYALYSPVWSPDGRYLSFDELLYYEGRGPFAYYDFEIRRYVSWEEPIGGYDWSPDSRQIAYDRLTYAANGEERIFVRGLLESEQRQISPDLSGGFTIYPVFSPQGDLIAYLADLDGMETPMYNLYVQNLVSGEARDLGRFEAVWELQWTADGQHLVFSAGPYDAKQVLQVSLADGTASVLAQGHTPAVPGR